MAGKTTLFIGVLCICILANVLLSKFPITVTIGWPHANTTGVQFHLVGIGVPSAQQNVLPVMQRATINSTLTAFHVNPSAAVPATNHTRLNVAHILRNSTHKPTLNEDTTLNNSSFIGKTENISLRNDTIEDPQTIARWREEMYCKIKRNVPFSTITKNSTKIENRSDEAVLPQKSLENLVHFNSCAVVSSSHGLRIHTYGREIDDHDAVLRFNCAPTEKFEKFVGNRTDLRLINTKIPGITCKKEFLNDSIAMFNHEITVIRNFGAINFGKRGIDARKDRFRVFENLKKYRRTHPNRTMPFIQRPDFGKNIVTELRRFCVATGRCKKTNLSPSTGMFGVVMMLHLCNWVHVFEILPSNSDNTNLRYYYDEKEKKLPPNEGIHSYNQERQYIRTLSLTSDQDVEDTGVALLQGLPLVHCD
ncbi:beta-galactoside alpha-2,6-sialyltransferase 1-like [Branchiostoma lanceolatum]|uniref:beta-galactoside alpha-2,6-sialyltransferase 1-like n=1 Tax=Branchiostoma lanceolatum TaxID=7740 RepID=UPI00345686A6